MPSYSHKHQHERKMTFSSSSIANLVSSSTGVTCGVIGSPGGIFRKNYKNIEGITNTAGGEKPGESPKAALDSSLYYR